MNESFVFYRSFSEAMRELPAEQFKAIQIALEDYALYGIVPEDLDPMLKGYFLLMKPQIDANNSRRENGRKGGSTPKQKQANESKSKQTEAKESKPKANANVNANANDNANEKSKRFVPPSVEEVAAYCRERRNRVNPQQFVDFYASKGWRVGNQPMKDWKAAMRTWEQRDKDLPRDNHGTEREQDLDAVLLNQIIGRRSNDNMGTMPTPGRAGYYTGELTAQYAGP